MNLFWDDCFSNAVGVTNRNFACNSNVGENRMVVSFDPPPGITQLVGGSAAIEIETASSPLPLWWHLSPGACRTDALALDFNAPVFLSCATYWPSTTTGSTMYITNFGGDPRRARVEFSFGIPEEQAGPVYAGTEYYAFQVVINNTRTVGDGACAGCLDAACIVLRSLWLYQPPGLPSFLLCHPRDGNYVTWQGGQVEGFPCPPFDYPDDCDATPTLRRTWGLVKGLYR